MKQSVITAIVLVTLTFGVYGFRDSNEGSITGKVRPASSVTNVWAVSGADSTVSNLQDGEFTLPVKAGTYKIVIGAIAPYKDQTIENVQVGDGAPTDVGTITLKK